MSGPDGAGIAAPSALVTGASGGIGQAVARRLAGAGYGLTVSGRDVGALAALRRELAGADVQVQVWPADMGAEAEVRGLAAAHADRFDRLDLLVLCAGTGTSGLLADYPLDRFDRQVSVNLRGPFALIQACLPQLRRSAAASPDRGARVIAVASVTGVSAEPGLAAYGATKAGLISLCGSVSAEEARHGISATAISPGYVDTDMSAWIHDQVGPGEMITPSDIADLVGTLAGLSAWACVPHVIVSRRGASQLRA
jgi:NAD(P)-dependent dehydrogenase (short-subunit alcohol dehydrogenase family)